MSTSKTGKHGHAKVNLVGIDIFSGKKYEDISPSTHNMEVPHVRRNEYLLANIEDGYMSLIVEGKTEPKEDVKVPEGDLGKDIETEFEAGKELIVTILTAPDEGKMVEQAISYKSTNN